MSAGAGVVSRDRDPESNKPINNNYNRNILYSVQIVQMPYKMIYWRE